MEVAKSLSLNELKLSPSSLETSLPILELLLGDLLGQNLRKIFDQLLGLHQLRSIHSICKTKTDERTSIRFMPGLSLRISRKTLNLAPSGKEISLTSAAAYKRTVSKGYKHERNGGQIQNVRLLSSQASPPSFLQQEQQQPEQPELAGQHPWASHQRDPLDINLI